MQTQVEKELNLMKESGVKVADGSYTLTKYINLKEFDDLSSAEIAEIINDLVNKSDKTAKMKKWEIYQNNELIDTVSFEHSLTDTNVKARLVIEDNYPVNIIVKSI